MGQVVSWVTPTDTPHHYRRSVRRALLVSLSIYLGACAPPVDLSVQAPATLGSEPVESESAEVVRIVDGDTIVVRLNDGSEWPVRLVGIDTPESVKQGSPVECFGREASAALKALLDGQSVMLVKDVEDTDRYDRLLRYVYLGEEMANARMVANGYAHAYTYPPNVRHADLFVQLQREAREANRGLWSAETCSGVP